MTGVRLHARALDRPQAQPVRTNRVVAPAGLAADRSWINR